MLATFQGKRKKTACGWNLRIKLNPSKKTHEKQKKSPFQYNLERRIIIERKRETCTYFSL